MSELEQILSDIEFAGVRRAEQRRWNPARVGDIDIRIAADGCWHHEGRPIRRDSLVRLFADVLRREDDDYYLVTPVEKLRIRVEDAPFVANLVDFIDDEGDDAIVFTTNIGERVVADRDHPIRVALDGDQPRPYLRLRDDIEALIGRGAFFELADRASELERAGRRALCIRSRGEIFELGTVDGD